MVDLKNDVLNLALDTVDNPYLMGGFEPVDTEIETSHLEVVGEIPSDLGAGTRYDFGPGRWGSEAPFAPRPGPKEEDDGYLMSFLYDGADGHSECVIIDAGTMDEVGRVIIPQRVPNGFHACWVPQETLDARAAG